MIPRFVNKKIHVKCSRCIHALFELHLESVLNSVFVFFSPVKFSHLNTAINIVDLKGPDGLLG